MIVRKPTLKEIETAKNWDDWSKEPSTFPWFYDEKETCYILAGSAEVADNKGNIIVFKKGDWVEFEQGLGCTWHIIDTIKKKYYFG
jgi:uncharacterized protein